MQLDLAARNRIMKMPTMLNGRYNQISTSNIEENRSSSKICRIIDACNDVRHCQTTRLSDDVNISFQAKTNKFCKANTKM